MSRLRIYWMVMMLSVGAILYSEVSITAPNLREKTGIAPRFFGPNALPVLSLPDGRTSSTLAIDLAGDGYWGYEGDWTADIFGKITIPLYTDRVNLSVWMPVQEWYGMTTERQHTCRIQDTIPISGHESGDVYISTDIQILRTGMWSVWTPDVALRAGIKTASGGGFDRARYFDNPAYWFDMSVGKSLYWGKSKTSTIADPSDAEWELRLSAGAGFLCWQTDNGRQNDAITYGVQLLAKHTYLSLKAAFEGYSGWEHYGDCPMTIRTEIAGHAKQFEPYVQYQYGLRDYPFHQLRVGLRYHIHLPLWHKPGK